MKFSVTLLLAALWFFSPMASAQYAHADPYETAVTQIQKAMYPSTTGIQHFRWLSLRLLNDPAMNPLFESLTTQKDVALRVDGFMGIALVSADKSLDAARVIQLNDPALRRILITEALGLDLLKPAALNGLFKSTDLTNYERTLLVAELNRQGQPWDKSLLADAPADPAAEVAGLASMLLLERADEGGWQRFLRTCSQLTPDDRTALLTQLANAARQYHIVAAARPLLELTNTSTGPDRMAAIATAVSVVPEAGRELLLEKIKTDRSQSNLVRMGLLMLTAKKGMQAADFEQLRNGDPLVEAMATAGAAIGTAPANQASALAALLENGNRSTTAYVLNITPTLPPEFSRPLLFKVLARVCKNNVIRSEDQISTIQAVQQLLRMPAAQPELLTYILQNSEKNVQLLEIAMSIVADSSDASAAAFARNIRGKLPRRGDSMALLALAKNFTPLTSNEIVELGSIASGGGKVDESSQIQAAWLYLKYTKREKDAIAQLTR
ncbi:MAG: hypothetical protein EXS12_06355 [Phycisphaerales bacterium]|nr:hypothetical protein [Phycisphaerales bacterium]